MVQETYTDVFGGGLITGNDPSFARFEFTASVTSATIAYPPPRILEADNTIAGSVATIVLPDARRLSVGFTMRVICYGTGNISIDDNAGGLVWELLSPMQVAEVYLRSNTTAAGSWLLVFLGETIGAFPERLLAGKGLTPSP